MNVTSRLENVADAFVSGNKWEIRFYWPITIDGMKVGVADTACMEPDQKFVRPRISE
jgi:hypothetical protein